MKRITLSALLMTLFLLLSCGSGSTNTEELKSKFLNVFTSFGDMVTNAFGIKADTKKSEVGNYFTAIAKTMTSVKNELQESVAKNENYSKVKSVVDQFINTLGTIAEGASEAAKGATTDTAIGNAVKDQEGAPGEAASVNALVKGIREIVGAVLKDDEGSAGATKTGNTEQKSVGKLLGGKDNGGTDAHAAAASASIGAVTGADILQAIAKSAEAGTGEVDIDKAKNAAEIAVAKNEDKEFGAILQDKDAVIAAGIALRAMAKDGKFAAKNEDKSANAVNGAVASAVNKTLSTLIIAIRKTIDRNLKLINEALAKPADATGGNQ
ncbi:variable large protein (plasmid) [Candidatus Borrelia fainii]|uniref:Variable large protein n=1 Tax=Candidatus Borrelia fainii TaxID=2518322 RepID=A0ABN6UST9_9SPIR|nr:variable large family protein [Candidatus Borrelia fainii]BDU63438.1 variable large protein [Candidatus Borrelia fainii]